MPAENESKIAIYHEITGEYLNYLSTDSEIAKSAKLSHWRYSLTNVFYRGKYARFILWDILAGVQNNFLFFIKKSEHADFITLINRIALFDRNSEHFFEEIKQVQNEKELCDLLFDYFLEIEKNSENKNEDYYRHMKALKRDINHFVAGCGIEKRIRQTMPCALVILDSISDSALSSIQCDMAYIRCQDEWYFLNKKLPSYDQCKKLNVNNEFTAELNSTFKKNIESLSGEQFCKIASATGDTPRLHYTYKVVEELDEKTKKDKANVQSFKAVWSSCAASMANFMASTEGSIALAGFKAGVMKLCVGLAAVFMFTLKCMVVMSGLFFGYIFAEDEFKSLGKQAYLGRLDKIKNPNTGEYESLKGLKWFMVCFISPLLALVAGTCLGSLAFFSIKSCVLPFVNVAPPLVFCKICFLCVIPLSTASFFLTLKNVISNLTWEKIGNYCESLTKQPDESFLFHKGRVFLEVLKWGIAISAMLFVGFGGYYVFRDKSIDMLHHVWTGLAPLDAEKIAKGISATFSITKFPFTVNKIRNVLQSVLDWMKNKWNSTKSEPEDLNRCQKEASSSTWGYLKGASLMLRASCTAGFYKAASVEHHLPFPLTSGSLVPATWGFSLAYYRAPTAAREKQNTTEPLVTSANRPLR